MFLTSAYVGALLHCSNAYRVFNSMFKNTPLLTIHNCVRGRVLMSRLTPLFAYSCMTPVLQFLSNSVFIINIFVAI